MPSEHAENGEAEAQETDRLLHSGDGPRDRRSLYKRLALAVLGTLLLLGLAAGVTSYALDLKWSPWRRKTGLPDVMERPPQPGTRNPSYFVRGRHGAVATEVGTCSQIGIDVLRDNGTATDAAIASALCIGVVNMFSSGIGGGGFMVSRPACDKMPCPEALSIDFRETAPTGSHPHMFDHDPLASLFEGKACGVPGELRGFEAAYKAYGGGVSWQRLFEPNIRLAEEHHVEVELARRLEIIWKLGVFSSEPQWREMFFRPDGKHLQEGDIIRRPALANTLRRLAEGGADAFYHGAIAESLVESIAAHGGSMTTEDFASYRAQVEPALVGTYRNRTIYTTHAPSSGPILLSLLNTLEPIEDFVEQGRTPLNMHRFIEAQKFAFAHRTEFGDPAFVHNAEKWREVMRKDFGRETLRKITDTRTHDFLWYRPHFDIHEDHGTTHIAVVDSKGGACSLTTTINIWFGNRVMDPRTGIILNDEMNDFSTPGTPDAFGLRPSPYNYPEGPKGPGQMGKRPLSSTSATIMEDEGGNLLAVGGSGGSRIFGAVAQTILLLDWGYDVLHAVEEPRLHDQLLPSYVSAESGMPADIIAGLKERGHNVTLFDINAGVAEVQAALRRDRWIYGASDSRKNGRAVAY